MGTLTDPAVRHVFAQLHGTAVHVCWCGKWPLHHVHTGNGDACTCDGCRTVRIVLPRRST